MHAIVIVTVEQLLRLIFFWTDNLLQSCVCSEALLQSCVCSEALPDCPRWLLQDAWTQTLEASHTVTESVICLQIAVRDAAVRRDGNQQQGHPHAEPSATTAWQLAFSLTPRSVCRSLYATLLSDEVASSSKAALMLSLVPQFLDSLPYF